MILGQVSWLDCFVFLVFLAPQLIFNVGFFPTLFCGIRALPFLVIKLPLKLFHERLLLSREHRSPFVQQASWFEDAVIRCVRYAFAYIPAEIGRVFFSKHVALPFFEVSDVETWLSQVTNTLARSEAECVRGDLDHLRPNPKT